MDNLHFEAVYKADVAAIRRLMRHRRSLRDSENALAGLIAVIDGNFFGLLEVYLDEGIDLNTHDSTGFTPLIWATRLGRDRMVRELLTAGADVNLSDADGMSPLHHAAFKQDIRLLKRLVEAGADVSKRNREGKTPIDLAGLRAVRISNPFFAEPADAVMSRLGTTSAAHYLERLSKMSSD